MKEIFADLQHNVRDGKIKIEGLVLLILYLMPFYFADRFGLLYSISSLAMVNLFYSLKNQANDHRSQKGRATYWVIVIGAIVFTVIQTQLFLSGKLDQGLSIGELPLIPTYTTFLYLLFPMYWLITNPNEGTTIFKLDRKSLTLTLILIIPLIFAGITMYIMRFSPMSSRTMLLCSAFQALIMAAFVEELFYRVFLYGVLRKLVSTPFAEILSGLLFSLTHLALIHQFFDTGSIRPLINLFGLFLLGVFYARIYERTKSIWPSIIYHASINGFISYGIQLIFG